MRMRWVRLVMLAGLGAVICTNVRSPAAAGAPEVRVLSSLETVRPEGTPGGVGEAKLEAARGEWESFQVVVHTGAAPMAALSLRAEPLLGAHGSRIEMRLYRVGFVQVETPSNTEGAPGLWPDPLIPAVDDFDHQKRNAFPIRVEAGHDGAAWIDVFVPRTAEPGSYRGAIVVEDGTRAIARVPVSLLVHRFTLPTTSSLPVTFGFAASTAGRGHFHRAPTAGEAQDLARKYALAALRDRIGLHGGTGEPAPYAADGAGKLRIDFAPYDAEIAPFLDGKADPGGPAEGARWTAFDLRVPYRLAGAERAAYLAKLEAHLASRGWIDRVFDYTADEPGDPQLPSVRARAVALRESAPRIPRLVTRAPCEGLAGAVDIWCPPMNLVEDKPGAPPLGPLHAPDKVRRGERVWWYQSCLSTGCDIVGSGYFTGWPARVVDAPPVAQRIFEWLTFRRGIGGELYYNTVEGYDGDPWRDPLRHGGNGDGTLFYPGRPDTIGGSTQIPVESIRLKRIRDGLEDYEYLKLLARLASPAEAQRLARRVADRAFDWDHDPAHLLSTRAEIARRLDALTP